MVVLDADESAQPGPSVTVEPEPIDLENLPRFQYIRPEYVLRPPEPRNMAPPARPKPMAHRPAPQVRTAQPLLEQSNPIRPLFQSVTPNIRVERSRPTFLQSVDFTLDEVQVAQPGHHQQSIAGEAQPFQYQIPPKALPSRYLHAVPMGPQLRPTLPTISFKPPSPGIDVGPQIFPTVSIDQPSSSAQSSQPDLPDFTDLFPTPSVGFSEDTEELYQQAWIR